VNQNRNAIVVIVVVVIVVLACCCVVAAVVTFTGGCTALGIGGVAAIISMPAPYGIDERPPVPASATADDVFPAKVSGYEPRPAFRITKFVGVALPEDTTAVAYVGPDGKVTTFAAQTGSEAEARQLVALVSERLEGGVSSHLSRSLPSKPAFVQWHVSTWRDYTYGIVWNNGLWVLGVTSPSKDARDIVADAFPY